MLFICLSLCVNLTFVSWQDQEIETIAVHLPVGGWVSMELPKKTKIEKEECRQKLRQVLLIRKRPPQEVQTNLGRK